MKDLRRVMLITSVFPPSWGSGVHRISKLYKYLPNFGYFPIVLTTKENSYGVIDHSIDHCFKQGLIVRLCVINWRTFSTILGIKPKSKNLIFQEQKTNNKFKKFIIGCIKNIYNILSIPDDRVLWIPLAIMEGYWTIRKYRIGLLYSTSPHHSSHVVALFLRRLTGLPWITDFRDPWAGNPFNSPQFRLHRFFDNLLERWVVKYSSKIVSISEPITEGLKKRYPDMQLKKFDVLLNSFDPDDFVDLEISKPFSNKFTISHAGTFYGDRSPEPFLIALMKLLEQKPNWREQIEVFFIGSFPQNGRNLGLLDPLKDVVKIVPYLPYKEMLKFLTKSALLLLIPGPGEGTITGKVFDYLALKKPILLLSQGNIALENILKRTKNSLVLPFEAIDRIVEALTLFVQEFFDNGAINMEVNEEEIQLLTSIEMARKFSRMMDELWKTDKRRFSEHDQGPLLV